MSEAKFTAVIWEAIDHGVGELCVFDTQTESAVCILDDSDTGYAWPEGYSVSQEARANAHLIAAAPELYEALLGVMDILDDPRSSEGQKIRQAALASLAKARGEV